MEKTEKDQRRLRSVISVQTSRFLAATTSMFQYRDETMGRGVYLKQLDRASSTLKRLPAVEIYDLLNLEENVLGHTGLAVMIFSL